MNAKRFSYFAIPLVLAGLQWARPAEASCTWQQSCTEGRCTQVPSCDTPPPDAAPVHPISRPPVVPAAKRAPRSQCAPRYICTGNICQTQTVCE